MRLHPCVACGFLVFEEPIGSYAICPICGWEDDHVQARYPGSAIGANHVSLYEYQQTIALKKAPLSVGLHRGARRLSGWRPLRVDEASARANEPTGGRSYFEATTEDDPPYYWETS